MADKLPLVSLILVVRNSELYIEKAIQSYLNQDYPHSRLELIIVDGYSDDETKSKINKLESSLSEIFHSVSILDNEKKILAVGWNIAIKRAIGEYVCRIDVHSEIPSNYISSMVNTLVVSDPKVVGVGGVLLNKSLSKFGRIACDFYSSKFGVGNSPFRIDKENGIIESDTAVFALYKKSLFNSCGLFNEKLGRNQDIEFHRRVSKNNFKLLTDYSLKCNYYVRSDLDSFIKKAYNDGYWVVKSNSYYIRHLIPLFFFVYIIAMIITLFFSDYISIIFPFLLYCFLSVFFAIKDGKKVLSKIFLPLLYLTYHMSYGYGSFVALIKKYFN